MTIARKTKPVHEIETFDWSLETENYAHADAFVTGGDLVCVSVSDTWIWTKDDLEELKAFIEVLIEEGPWE